MKLKIAIMITLAMLPGLLVAAGPTLAQFKGISADQQKKDYDAAKKKPDDSQYKGALDRMPEKKFDPWQNMR